MGHWPGQDRSRRQLTSFGNLTRSQLMARVRAKGNRTTEVLMAELLRSSGLNGWRRHLKLAGKPDFAWPQFQVALFVDGCFWHGHDCGKNINPKTNAREWRNKITNNARRDRKIVRELRKNGWSVIRIWECKLKKQPQKSLQCIKRLLTSRINIMDNNFKNCG